MLDFRHSAKDDLKKAKSSVLSSSSSRSPSVRSSAHSIPHISRIKRHFSAVTSRSEVANSSSRPSPNCHQSCLRGVYNVIIACHHHTPTNSSKKPATISGSAPESYALSTSSSCSTKESRNVTGNCTFHSSRRHLYLPLLAIQRRAFNLFCFHFLKLGVEIKTLATKMWY